MCVLEDLVGDGVVELVMLARHALVLAPPQGESGAHRLSVFSGVEAVEKEVDLSLHSHAAVPLYAYDAGHPIRLLTRRGAWEECIVVGRAAGCNQFVLRMPPVGNNYWAPLLPWPGLQRAPVALSLHPHPTHQRTPSIIILSSVSSHTPFVMLLPLMMSNCLSNPSLSHFLSHNTLFLS